MDDKKITFQSRSIFGCSEMKKSFSVLALEELFASENDKRNHDKDDMCGGSHQAFVASDNGDHMHFPFKNMEMMNEFSSTAWLEDKAYWSQNPDTNDSGLPVTLDSQSLICVDSPALGNNQTGQEKASGGSSGSSDEGSSKLIDPKRAKRMISNRQSAQRSRKRKQAHLAELEQQVEQLRGENSTLFKQLANASHQFKEASTNHRVLKSGVEALRAKVKLAEDMVARGTVASGLSHLLQNYLSSRPQGYMNNNMNCIGINVSRALASGDISESTYSGMTDSSNTGLGNASCVTDGSLANTLPPLPDLWEWGSNAAPVSK